MRKDNGGTTIYLVNNDAMSIPLIMMITWILIWEHLFMISRILFLQFIFTFFPAHFESKNWSGGWLTRTLCGSGIKWNKNWQCHLDLFQYWTRNFNWFLFFLCVSFNWILCASARAKNSVHPEGHWRKPNRSSWTFWHDWCMVTRLVWTF